MHRKEVALIPIDDMSMIICQQQLYALCDEYGDYIEEDGFVSGLIPVDGDSGLRDMN